VTGIEELPSAKLAAHRANVAKLREEYAAVPPGSGHRTFSASAMTPRATARVS
jgi:hypothetical protein